nr:MAG TPA: hypothetical protein [Caudoviricetes sp.]
MKVVDRLALILKSLHQLIFMMKYWDGFQVVM